MKYFHHDTDARKNRKIRRLIKTHGMVGYGIWWALVEELSLLDREGFQIQAEEMWLEDFAEDLKLTDYRVLIRVFDTLAELRLIDPQLWAEHVVISHGVIERGDGYVKKKAENAERKRRQREREHEEWEAQKAELERISTEINDPVTRDSAVTESMSHGVTPSETESKAETDINKDIKGDETSPDVKSSGKKKKNPSTPVLHKEEFENWWPSWYGFCKEVIDRGEDRKAAVKAWDKVILEYMNTEEYPESIDVVNDIFEGSDYFFQEKRKRSHLGKDALAIPNECRFLAGKTDRPTPYWKTAIDYKRSKDADQLAAPQVSDTDRGKNWHEKEFFASSWDAFCLEAVEMGVEIRVENNRQPIFFYRLPGDSEKRLEFTTNQKMCRMLLDRWKEQIANTISA